MKGNDSFLDLNMDFSRLTRPYLHDGNETVRLYHGSKSGIAGDIVPVSCIRCDFGQGFYMGTEPTQPLTLICNYPTARLYTLEMELNGLNILDIEPGLEWAFLVAYHRGKMEHMKESVIYRQLSVVRENVDLLIGYIANDRMFVVLDRFFKGEITDIALVRSLSALKLGRQYVALTQNACKKITIMDEQKLSADDRAKLKEDSDKNRRQGIAMANEICRRYRREGRYFDEILEGK